MKKFLNFFKIVIVVVGLGLLLIETSTFFRRLFTSDIVCQNNLTAYHFGSVLKDFKTPHINTDGLIFASSTNQNPPSAERYLRITTETPLLKTSNDLDTSTQNTLFLLPKSYFVRILRETTLKSGEDGYYVRYNTYEGYAVKTAFSTTMSDNTTMQNGIEITLNADAGSYLRATPEILDTNRTKLIPASTSGLILVGKIYGDTPSDGSSNLWYFVEYSSGPTTTYTGYIYSERCILSKPLVDLVLDSDKSETTASATTTPENELNDTSSTTTETIQSTPNANTNPGLIVIALIFIIPIVVIFIMLVKKPKRIYETNELMSEIDEDFNPETTNFTFPKTIPAKIRAKHEQKALKFKTREIDKLSRFVKVDTSLETAKAFDDNDNSYDRITTPQTDIKSIENAIEKPPSVKERPVTLPQNPPKSSSPVDTPETYKKPSPISKLFQRFHNSSEKKRQITKNRKRDRFMPTVLSSDDYFEYADAFELSPPIDSHFVFATKTKPAKTRTGKKINKY